MGHLLKCPDCAKCFRKRSVFVKHWNRKHNPQAVVWDRPGKKPTKGK